MKERERKACKKIAKTKNKRKRCETKECKFTPNLQSLIACFSPKMTQFLLKLF